MNKHGLNKSKNLLIFLSRNSEIHFFMKARSALRCGDGVLEIFCKGGVDMDCEIVLVKRKGVP